MRFSTGLSPTDDCPSIPCRSHGDGAFLNFIGQMSNSRAIYDCCESDWRFWISVRFPSLSSSWQSDNLSNSLLLRIPDDNHVRYFATFCITSGTYTTIGLTIAWCTFLCVRSRIFF